MLITEVKDIVTIIIKMIMLINEPFLWRILALSKVSISILHLTIALMRARR